ncbi:MAG TPA: hypothetical protein P5313_07430 [Spirochaetia bacterium]|nr:hypothetical protein [Spirochaetia bacterium]
MKHRRMLLLAAAVLLSAAAAWTLDLRDGRILVSLDERTARLSVHYLADAARNRYVSLLSEQDARTSYPTLAWNGKFYRLGESADFRISVRREGANAVVEYRSSFALVRQTVLFLRSRGAPDADGVMMEFAIENLSGNPAAAGLRILLDTYQGERGKRHFEIDGTGIVGAELSLSGSSIPARLLTPGDSGATLQIQLSGEGLTRPDRLILSNWKRINDAEWGFEASPGRSFTLLPFSIEDSAAALYFEPSELRSGGTRIIRTALGNRTETGYSTSPIPGGSPPEAAASPQAAMSVKPDPFVGARTDIAALREILARIDALLAAGGTPDPAQVEEIRRLLGNIRSRPREY